MARNRADELQLFCHLFADDRKMEGKSADVDLKQWGLDKMAAWAIQNSMLLNAAESQYLYFGLNLPSTLLFPYSIGGEIPRPQIPCTKDLEVLLDCFLSTSPQIHAALTKARGHALITQAHFRKACPSNVSSLVLRNGSSSP